MPGPPRSTLRARDRRHTGRRSTWYLDTIMCFSRSQTKNFGIFQGGRVRPVVTLRPNATAVTTVKPEYLIAGEGCRS